MRSLPSTLRQALAAAYAHRAWLLGGAVSCVVVVLAAAALQFTHALRCADQASRNALLARVLADQVERTLNTTHLAMASLTDKIDQGVPPGDAQLAPGLAHALVSLPALRDLVILGAQGQVLQGGLGWDGEDRVDLRVLGTLPGPGQTQLGAFFLGRRLPRPATLPAREGPGTMTLIRRASTGGAQAPLVVALLNSDAFGNFQQVALDDATSAATLSHFNGQVMAATQSAIVGPGGSVAGLLPTAKALPALEQARWQGPGLSGEQDIATFKALRHHPLLVIVSTPQDAALAQWWPRARMLVGLALALVAAVLYFSLITHRSLLARRKARALVNAAQQQVAARERELDLVVSSVRDLLFRTDADGRLTFVNAGWDKLAGTQAADRLGSPLWEVFLPPWRQAVQQLFRRDGASGPRQARATLAGPDHTLRAFDISLVALTDAQGGFSFAGSAVDVTALLDAQAQLRSQLLFNAALIDNNPLPICVTDRQRRFLRVNHAWETYAGLSSAQALGRPSADFFGDDQDGLHRAHDERLLQEGGDQHYEAQHRDVQGHLHDLFLSKSALPGQDGRTDGVVTVIMDISEFREAERQTRRAKDAAEESLRAKGEFVANISHELRTPLQSILGFSEIGLHRSREHPRFVTMFQSVHDAGQRMLGLVNDLLDLSKLQTALGSLNLFRQDLRPLLRAVVHEMYPQLQQRGLTLHLDLPPVDLVGLVDATRFSQVLRNVLANAIRFSPDGGTLGLHAEVNSGGTIVLRLTDEGPGIPPAELDSIFEAFVQSSRTKDGSGGTGLGLAICRTIMQAHDGTIEAENRPDGGSLFRIELPAARFGDTGPVQL